MKNSWPHQYIERETNWVKSEQFFGNRSVQFIYSQVRENAQILFKALTSPRLSDLLAYFIYDSTFGTRMCGTRQLFSDLNIDFSECLESPETLDSPRKIFERKIRYWETRPLPLDDRSILSPSDSRVLVGSFANTSHLFLKDKFFNLSELLENRVIPWKSYFQEGDFAVFRLTPEKYHYNHTPVSGRVLDFFEIEGEYHSCHPQAVITMATPFSKNKRVVTIIDTDVEEGTQIGLVAMVEVVALLIGDIEQRYSEQAYDDPQPITRGMFLKKGNPKSLYRPGSSTNILIFEKDRVEFCEDLIRNMLHPKAQSVFSRGFGRSLVETEVKVRSPIAWLKDRAAASREVNHG